MLWGKTCAELDPSLPDWKRYLIFIARLLVSNREGLMLHKGHFLIRPVADDWGAFSSQAPRTSTVIVHQQLDHWAYAVGRC